MITFPVTCPAFSACGGTLPGTFTYTSGCADDAEFAPLVVLADSICGAGMTTITNKSGTIQGGLTFSATQVARSVSGAVNFTANLGGTCGNSGVCTQISGALTAYGFTGTCTFDATAGKCVCPLTRSLTATGVETYSVTGNQLTTMGAKTRLYDYCVTAGGSNLTYREVTANSGMNIRDPGYYSLIK
jgi:hypothetical protein